MNENMFIIQNMSVTNDLVSPPKKVVLVVYYMERITSLPFDIRIC